MPSYPSSTCATDGSYYESDCNDAKLPSRSSESRETSKHTVVDRKHKSTNSTPVTSTSDSTASKAAISKEVEANKLEHTSSTSSPPHVPASNTDDSYSAHVNHTLNQEYCIARFCTGYGAVGIHAEGYTSAQDTIKAHVNPMNTYLNDFDKVFYTGKKTARL